MKETKQNIQKLKSKVVDRSCGGEAYDGDGLNLMIGGIQIA
jgi:hypothetical protein